MQANCTEQKAAKEKRLQELARLLLVECGESGFALFIFDREDVAAAPEWIANVTRPRTIAMLKRFIAREEARLHMPPPGSRH